MTSAINPIITTEYRPKRAQVGTASGGTAAPVSGDLPAVDLPLGTANRNSPPPPTTLTVFLRLKALRARLRDRAYHPLTLRGNTRRFIGRHIQGKGYAVGWCGLIGRDGATDTGITDKGLTDVVRCGSPYCPVCGRVKAKRAQLWMGKALAAAAAQGFHAALITTTISHDAADTCADALDRYLEVRKLYLRRIGSKSRIGRVGSCDALEATYGINGFHHHGHSLWISRVPLTADLIAELKAMWVKAATDCGAVASFERGLDVEIYRGAPADAEDWLAAIYAAKGEDLTWEVAGAAAKRSRKGSLTISDLIALSESDDSACRLAAEYFSAMAGKVRFNCGALASKLGIPPMSEVDDERYDDVIENEPPPVLARVKISDLGLLAGLWSRAELALIKAATLYGQRGVDRLVRFGHALAIRRGIAPILSVSRHDKPIGAWTYSDWCDAANDPTDSHYSIAQRYAT